ncbi:MAG: caspase family protein [Saprospirales bacterium]|nr:caspase family protein [Saprospirales bacterium]
MHRPPARDPRYHRNPPDTKAQKGSLAVFHFSGHGQQVRDDDGDELDGFDEAIVPYDSPLQFRERVYEGENLIRDEELGRLLDQVRRKLGKRGHLLTLLDSCHSGTGTRGMGAARGTAIIMADSNYIAGRLEEETLPTSGESWENTQTASRLAPEVAFFGSSARQLNYEMSSPEGGMVGSLTYAFCQALEGITPGSSYEMLYDQVRLLMGKWVPRQQPQAEGPLDLAVFGGRVVEQKSYLRITPGGLVTTHSAMLPAGQLHGFFPGTKLGLYPPGTYDWQQTTPFRTGRITHADLLESEIELDGPANPDSSWPPGSTLWSTTMETYSFLYKCKFRTKICGQPSSGKATHFPHSNLPQDGELSIQQEADMWQILARWDGIVGKTGE